MYSKEFSKDMYVCIYDSPEIHTLFMDVFVLTGRVVGSSLQPASYMPVRGIITITLEAPRCATYPAGQFSTALAMMSGN